MKKIILIILGVVIAGALVVVFCISFTETQRVTIDASFDVVAPQVNSLPNWKNWYGEGVGRLVVVRGGPISIVVRDTSRSFEDAVAVVPGMDGRTTEVLWSRPMTIWQGITGPGIADLLQHLDALERYIENPKHYYGFEIHIRTVTDTLFAVKEARVVEAEVGVERGVLLRGLRAYLGAHPEMKQNDSVITGYEPVPGGLVHLVVGIPVDRRGVVKDSVRFLSLPRGGRLLSGLCDSGQTDALKRAMDRYMADKRLQMVAIPFSEQGLTGGGYALNYPIW